MCRYYVVVRCMLTVCVAENETELSFFNRAAYEAFKSNPEIKWE